MLYSYFVQLDLLFCHANQPDSCMYHPILERMISCPLGKDAMETLSMRLENVELAVLTSADSMSESSRASSISWNFF